MKKITQMAWTAVLLLTMIVVSCCNVRAGGSNNSDIEARLAKQDSLCGKFKQKLEEVSLSLDTLSKETAGLKLRMEKLEQQVEKGNSSTGCMIAIAILSCILVVCMISIHVRLEKFVKKKDLKDIQCEIKQLQDGNVLKTANVSSKPYPTINDFKGLSDRMDRMQKRMDEMEQSQGWREESTPIARPLPPESEVASPKIMYAPLNSDGYFTELSSSLKEDCLFKVNLKSDTEGTFTILSLDKLRSCDGWEKVVEYDGGGSCSISQAKNFTPSSLGKCEKAGGRLWKITKKLEIKIS